jgi:glycogen operon protein
LNDLVSYNTKHNEDNGEENRDGTDHNLSWNCGVEGPTDDPAIVRLRHRQVKNFLTINFLGLGVPMLLMGDEVRRTQRGNNNAYCQDNEISWFDWTLQERYADVYRFVQQLIAFRLHRDFAGTDEFVTLNELLRQARLQWHGVKLGQPDWGDDSHALAVTVWSLGGHQMLHVMFNAYWEALEFELPPVPPEPAYGWRRWLDTSLDAPHDISPAASAPLVATSVYCVESRSVAALLARVPEESTFLDRTGRAAYDGIVLLRG